MLGYNARSVAIGLRADTGREQFLPWKGAYLSSVEGLHS